MLQALPLGNRFDHLAHSLKVFTLLIGPIDVVLTGHVIITRKLIQPVSAPLERLLEKTIHLIEADGAYVWDVDPALKP